MATLRDVAARVGASVGSVSAVVNGTAPVSAELRERILRVVDELGYVPHAMAVSLKSGRSRMIGLVMPDIANPHFARLAQAIEGACDAAGFMLTLCGTSDSHEKELKQLQALRGRRVDGIVFIPGGLSTNDHHKLRAAISVPVVILDRQAPELQADVILLDNEGAAGMLTRHLIAGGHRRIGIVAGAERIEISRQRVAGYRATLAEHGIAMSEELVVFGQFQTAPAFDASLRLIDQRPRPTAVIATSNHTTIGLMRALAARGIACPADISVASIDDFSWAEGFHPRLTVAAQPAEEMGAQAVRWLLERIIQRETGPPRIAVHDASLIVRGSTRTMRIASSALQNKVDYARVNKVS